MAPQITAFLKKQTCLSLATSYAGTPHCASCFYVFWEEECSLVFKSDPVTRHIREALLNNQVAGTIVPDRLSPMSVQGIQFSGIFVSSEKIILKKANTVYYTKYPFARLHKGCIFLVRIREIKMTETRNGIRKKIYWKCNEF
jgi:hypothetical protein